MGRHRDASRTGTTGEELSRLGKLSESPNEEPEISQANSIQPPQYCMRVPNKNQQEFAHQPGHNARSNLQPEGMDLPPKNPNVYRLFPVETGKKNASEYRNKNNHRLDERSSQKPADTGATPEVLPPSSPPPTSINDPVQSHPITQALQAFHNPEHGLTPVQIIADSLFPRPSFPGKRHTEPETEDLIREIPVEKPDDRASEEQNFWNVWLGHQDYLRSQCIRLMSGNMADAEDALSNAMLRASQKFIEYSGSIVNEKAWLSKLVYNVCIDHYRREKRTECRSFDQESGAHVTDAMFTEPAQSPEEIALCQEQLRRLDERIGELSENLRVPLFLRCIEGWSYPDIAEELDIRTDTVRKRIQLARDHLRRGKIR